MPRNHTSNLFNITPYYDDYDETKKFLRTLFRPGRSVQARELTQLQTVLQTQVERVGSHMFNNGSVIIGGEISESNINYARLKSPIATLNSLVGEKVTDGTVVAQVYYTEEASEDTHQMAFFQYTTQGTFAPNAELGTTGSDHAGITFNIKTDNTDGISAVGTEAKLFTINSGVYFIDGYFVLSDTQSIVPYDGATASGGGAYRSFATPTNSIGWSINRLTKSADDDNTLRDPASGFYNYNAPGADRYVIDLDIKRIEFTSSLGGASGDTVVDETNYIELIRMIGGSTTKTVRYTDYADIEETFARRTYDESGNYTVNTPGIEIKDYNSAFGSSDTTKFAVGIGTNKSYVNGYEIDTQSTAYLPIDKPRDFVNANDEILDVDFGNYIIVDEANSAFGLGIDSSNATTGFVPFAQQRKYDLTDGAGGATLGTTHLRTIKRVGGQLRAYVFNTIMSGTNKFSSSRRMIENGSHTGTTGSFMNLTVDGDGFVGTYSGGDKSLLIPTADNKTITEGGILQSSYIVQESGTIHIPAGTGKTGSLSVTNKNFIHPSDDDYVVVVGATAGDPANLLSNSDFDVSIDNIGTTKTLTLTLNSVPSTIPTNGITASIIYTVEYDSDSISIDGSKNYRTITGVTSANNTVERTEVVSLQGASQNVYQLDHSHIKSIDALSIGSSSVPVSSITLIDDGQRESSIVRGKLYIPASLFSNNNDITVSYTYWSHTGIGPVTVNSYIDAGIAYEDIGKFTDTESGNRYDLRNHIDFRPVYLNTGVFDEFGIPYTNTLVSSTIDYNYYLPRIDKLTLCGDRTYRVIKGASSLSPEAPQTNPEDMDLYTIIMNPYVFDLDDDVKIRYTDNKRFTMRQIGEIEDDLNRVETDNYLESLMSDAIARASSGSATPIEEGIFVDDFSGHAFSDVTNKDHNCSMDYSYRKLRPAYGTDSVPFEQGTIGSGLVKSSDGIVTYKFTAIDAFTSIEGSTLPSTGTISINPFGATDFFGNLKLTPTSDVFYSTNKNPKVFVNTFGENNSKRISGQSWTSAGKKNGFGTEYKEWLQRWVGEENVVADNTDVDPQNRAYINPIKTAKSKLPGRITETISDRVLNKSVVPYMRSVGITFSADGMLPGSTVYAIFDGTLVGDTDGYLVDTSGSVTNNLTITDAIFSTGEKLFRLTDSSTDNLVETNTAADAKFYAQGVLNLKNSSVKSVRPPMVRRKSTKSENIINDYFEQTLDNNFSAIVNGLEPLCQEIIVDYGVYPQGTFLSSVELFFSKADDTLPVTIQIRPIVNGSPHPSIVVPFSEVTVKPTQVSNGPDITKGTKFTFSSPVYLDYGKYAVCAVTNSPDNKIFIAKTGELELDANGNTTSDVYENNNTGTGIRLGSMFTPLNNGSRTEKTDETLQMVIERCQFNGEGGQSENKLTMFGDYSGATMSGQILNVVSNNQLFTSSDIDVDYSLVVGSGPVAGKIPNIQPNKDIHLNGRIDINSDDDLELHCVFSTTINNKISPIIDTERLSGILAYRRSGGVDLDTTAETLRDSSSSSNTARYVSKIVTLTGTLHADGINVYLKCNTKEGKVAVFVKTDTGDDNFDDNSWSQVGNTIPANTSGGVDNITLVKTGMDFSRYSIKIVMLIDEQAPESAVPVIKDLRVVPTRS